MQLDWSLRIEKITVHPIAIPLLTPFETSFGVQTLRRCALVRVQTASGAVGWGEVVTDWEPGYSYETTQTALHILNDFLIPRLKTVEVLESDKRWDWLHGVRGHPLAKHALISAILTAMTQEHELSLADFLKMRSGASDHKTAVEVGVSIGIQPGIEQTLERIQKFLDEGYQRIKLKIKPGWDVTMLRAVRSTFPDIKLMADANSAYSLADIDLLKKLDAFNLMMIEQPLAYNDIYEHSLLQKALATPICLDESLHSLSDVRVAHSIGACRIVNLKPQRVGGLYEAIKIHNYCLENGIDLWIGGMLETGVGRSVSLALASLPGVNLPSDLSASSRYYNPDLAAPTFDLNPADSTISVPTAPGLGVQVDMAQLMEASARYQQQE